MCRCGAVAMQGEEFGPASSLKGLVFPHSIAVHCTSDTRDEGGAREVLPTASLVIDVDCIICAVRTSPSFGGCCLVSGVAVLMDTACKAFIPA